MLKIQKWAQGKNPLFAFLAINFASVARDCCEAMCRTKDRRVYNHKFPLPELTSWFAMYGSRKPVLSYKRLIANTSDLTDGTLSLMRGLRMLDKLVKRDPKHVITITRQDREMSLIYWREMCAKTFAEIKEDIAETALSPELKEKLTTALVKDELPLGFYFLVYAPCQLLYGNSPHELYRNAVNGSKSAIENLLKVDPLILHDPAIGYQIQKVRLNGKANDYEQILNAISKHPSIEYQDIADQRRSIKSDLGAEIFKLAKAMKIPLKAPQIRSLYDAFAYDFNGYLVDTDLKSPAGFDTTVREKAKGQKMNQKIEKQK